MKVNPAAHSPNDVYAERFSKVIMNAWPRKHPLLRVLPDDSKDFFNAQQVVNGQHSWLRDGAQVDFCFDGNLTYLSGFDCVMQSSLLYYYGSPVFDPTRPGFWKIVTPTWNQPWISHPAGINAIPGEAQWVTTSTLELLHEVATTQIRVLDGYLSHPEAAGFKPLNRKMQSHYKDRIRMYRLQPDRERATKREYKVGLGKIRQHNEDPWILYRPDIAYYVISTANAKLWRKAYQAVDLGHDLVGFHRIDTLCFQGQRGHPEEWPPSFRTLRYEIEHRTFKIGYLKPCPVPKDLRHA